jgi:predicted RNA-binding Zn ribbon-like protein
MTGERVLSRRHASTQPGGRSPAPGQLALVQGFINTHYDLEVDHGAEVLGSPVALTAWLSAAGLIDRGTRLRAADLDRALTLRESLRALAATGTSDAREQVDTLANGARLEVRFTPDGPRYSGARGTGFDGAVGSLLAIVAEAMTDGTWPRLKVCPGDGCGWAFYDHSRNRSGVWCSMAVCGGREKARAHYRRRHGRDGET